MTKTEAAETIANEMRVFARKNGLSLNKDLAEARVSEFRGASYDGTYLGDAAKVANPKTVLRVAKGYGEV